MFARQRACMQATRTLPIVSKGGSASLHAGSTSGQRGWKRQPAGTFVALAGSPASAIRGGPLLSSSRGMRGAAANKARV